MSTPHDNDSDTDADTPSVPSRSELETAAYLSDLAIRRIEPHQVKRIVMDLVPRWTWQGRALKELGSAILDVGELKELPGPGGLPWSAREVKINRPKGFNQDQRSDTLYLWLDSKENYRVQL